MQNDSIIRNINLSLAITVVTGVLSIGLFVWAYFTLKIIWLLIVPLAIFVTLIVFAIMAFRMKAKYLSVKEKSEKNISNEYDGLEKE